MPADHKLHKEWLGQQVEHAKKNSKPLAPVLQEFKELIESNPRIYMYFTSMFDEVPQKKQVYPNEALIVIKETILLSYLMR